MIPIHNFEEHVNDLMIKRGLDYYLEGRVINISSDGFTRVIADVEGSYEYQVIIILDSKRENIKHSECNCPYDFGAICKHQVASFYELREALEDGSENDLDDIGRKMENSKVKLESVLIELDKKELMK